MQEKLSLSSERIASLRIEAKYVVLFHHFRRFLEAAAGCGIDVAPLKGAHLLTSVYRRGEDRGALADIDFLVRDRDWERTGVLLQKQGFIRLPIPRRPVSEKEGYEADFSLEASRGRNISFEPHRCLIQPARHPIDYDALWDRSVASSFDGAPCRRLSVEDHLLHAVIHVAHHFFIEPARMLRDVELLVSHGGADLDTVVVRARQWQCARTTWLVLTLLEEAAPHLGASRFAARLAPPKRVQGALRNLVPDVRGFRQTGANVRVMQARLLPLLLDTPRQMIRFFGYYGALRVRDELTYRREQVAGRTSGRAGAS